jgi:hypothetical protein
MYVSDNADLESALYDTAMIQNQCCIRQELISIFKGMFLPKNFSFEAMSAVGYSADTELALYPTTLIQN